MTPHLPGIPGRKIRDAWAGMDKAKRDAFRPHLLGSTSAEYLADWLARNGTPVSASSIRTYRRSLRKPKGGAT
jgi:hypothetical protein